MVEERITLSNQELDRVSVMKAVLDRRLRQREAARLLGVCDRSFRRYMQRYEEAGAEGLLDGRMNEPSPRCASIDEVMELQDLYSSPNIA